MEKGRENKAEDLLRLSESEQGYHRLDLTRSEQKPWLRDPGIRPLRIELRMFPLIAGPTRLSGWVLNDVTPRGPVGRRVFIAESERGDITPLVTMRPEDILKQMTGTNLCAWRRTIRRIVKDRDLTEEVLQESWRRMLASRVDLPTPHDWENYFKRVLINTARDHWRARVRASEKSTALDAAHHLPDQREDQLLRVLNAERQAHEGQILREVRAIIDRLPATQRQAILLLIGKDRSETLEAISRREGIAISTLRSRMYSGIRRIRRLLQQKGLLLKDEG